MPEKYFQSQGEGHLLEVAVQDDICFPVVALVGREVGSSRVPCTCCIVLVKRSGGDAVISFCMPSQNQGWGGLLCL